jgi:hypothetical protein
VAGAGSGKAIIKEGGERGGGGEDTRAVVDRARTPPCGCPGPFAKSWGVPLFFYAIACLSVSRVALYMKRAAATGSDADHKRTLQLLEQALAVAKPGSFYQMQCLFNLGVRLAAEYSQSQDIAVLSRAIDMAGSGVILSGAKNLSHFIGNHQPL